MTETKAGSTEGTGVKFLIAPPTMEDAAAIGPMQLQSWLETYQNPELGIDEAWIREKRGFIAEEAGTKFRKELFEKIEQGDESIFYRVAKDDDGNAVGFAMAKKTDKPNEPNSLEALYTLQEVQGKGLGSKMMDEMMEWLGDDKPVSLEAASYNQHAIEFYERYGFELTGKETEFIAPMMMVEMVKK